MGEKALNENTPKYRWLLYLGSGIMDDFYFFHYYPVINTVAFVRI